MQSISFDVHTIKVAFIPENWKKLARCYLHRQKIEPWCDCIKDDMESLGLPPKDAQFRNKW